MDGLTTVILAGRVRAKRMRSPDAEGSLHQLCGAPP